MYHTPVWQAINQLELTATPTDRPTTKLYHSKSCRPMRMYWQFSVQELYPFEESLTFGHFASRPTHDKWPYVHSLFIPNTFYVELKLISCSFFFIELTRQTSKKWQLFVRICLKLCCVKRTRSPSWRI